MHGIIKKICEAEEQGRRGEERRRGEEPREPEARGSESDLVRPLAPCALVPRDTLSDTFLRLTGNISLQMVMLFRAVAILLYIASV